MFIFDTNTFITASRQFYGFDIAPGFWDWIRDPALLDAASSAHVKAEIDAGRYPLEEDLLKQWAAEVHANFWLDDTPAVVDAMKELTEWVEAPERIYTQPAREDFLRSVDYRLIAQAKVSGAVLVTHEISDPNCKRKVKIPDACRAVGAASTDPFSAYRALGLRLVAA